MTRPTRIAFMTTIGRNIGDEFIREGIRGLLDSMAIDYDPFYVDKHDLTSLDQMRLDETVSVRDKFRDADIIIQAGAPVYWCNGAHRSYTAEWYKPLWRDRIFHLGPAKPVLNLGAGAGQGSVSDLSTLLADPQLATFAREAAAACRLTTSRDPLAGAYLDQLGISHLLSPCPAFHASLRINGGRSLAPRDLLAVNLMPIAGHFRLKTETDGQSWRSVVGELLPALRRQHRLLFVAHDRKELELMRSLCASGENVFHSDDYRDYLSVYSRVSGIVSNRVHAAVVVAGFGRPAVLVGNDARIGIAAPIGFPAIDSSQVTTAWVLEALGVQFDNADSIFDQRMSLRSSSARQYVSAIHRAIAGPTAVSDAVLTPPLPAQTCAA